MSQAADRKIPDIVKSKLTGLRLKVGAWLIANAMARIIPAILGLLAFIFVVDWFLEMDVPQRIIMAVLAVAAILVVVYFKMFRPFSQRLSDDALILAVEKQNVELRDSLISAVQFARDVDIKRQGISPAMVEATIEHGIESASNVNFGNALNERQHVVNMSICGVSAVLLGAFVFGMLNNDTMKIFADRFFFYGKSEYARNTYLEFYDPESQIQENVLKIYRGQDCKLIVHVQEDSLVMVDKVRMFYRDDASNYWVQEEMRRTNRFGGREFEIVYKSVAVDFEVRARGGDGRTKILKVQLEEPPQFSNLAAEVVYPTYTVELRPGDSVRVFDREQVFKFLGPDPAADECWSEVADVTDNGEKLVSWGLIDAEQLATVKSTHEATPEKNYVQIARQLDMFTELEFAEKLSSELKIKTVRSELDRNMLRDESDLISSFGGKLTVLDGCSIRLTAESNCELAVAELIHSQVSKPFERSGEMEYSLLIPANEVRNGIYQIKLRDETMREPPRSASFEIDIAADQTPEVRATLKGISGLVLNRAKLPFTVTVSDDFQTVDLFLRYSWQDDTGEQKNSGEIHFDEYEPVPSWDNDKADNTLKVSEILPIQSGVFTEQFFDLDTLPKDQRIPPGAGLNIAIVAVDNDNVPEANIGVSKEFLIRVVSEEEFLADLLRREKEARQELELVYKRQQTTQTDTEALSVDEKTVDETDEQFLSEVKTKLSEYSRNQRLLGENIEGVISRIEDLLVEGMNNRIDESTGEFEDRYSDRIIGPLQSITDVMIFDLKAALDSARRDANDNEKRNLHLTEAAGIQTEILETLNSVLKELSINQSFQDAINSLFEAKKEEEKLRKKTEDESKKLIKGAISGNPDGSDKPKNDK